MLVATNVAWSLWLQAEVWIKLLRSGLLAFLQLHIKDILHFQAHMTHISQHEEVRTFVRYESSYLRTCRGCRPAAASAACWTSCLRPPAASSEGRRCPGSSPRGSEWDEHVPLKHRPMSANRKSHKTSTSRLFYTRQDYCWNSCWYKDDALVFSISYWFTGLLLQRLQPQRQVFVLIIVKSCMFGEL